jgi:hypothetical protein
MAHQDRFESRLGQLVASGDAIQELGLAQARHGPAVEQSPQVSLDFLGFGVCHQCPSANPLITARP